MSFLNPVLLWGLLGVSVPVVIHLLNRFRYREVRWAAMDLLRKALVLRSRRVRIEDLLLLALRCLAVLLVALALARPTMTSAGGRWPGADGGAGAVVAIDASFSMGHRPGVHSRFERAMDRVREALATLPAGAPVSLLALGDRPRILLRNVGLDAGRIEKVLEGLRPLPEGFGVEAALEEIDGLLSEIRAGGREIHLVTDAQAATWREISPRARETLRSLAAKGRAYFLLAGQDGDENLAVADLERISGAARKGATGRFRAAVRNLGSRVRETVSVTLLVDGTAVDSRTIDRIEPGATAEAILFGKLEREGSVPVTARIEGDPLPADDSRHLVVEVRARTRVLCIAVDRNRGATELDSFEGEIGYLTAALAAGGQGPDAAVSVEHSLPADSAARSLSGIDVVVLADVPDVPPDLAGAILRFVRGGGGLIVFLGDAVQPATLNARFRSAEVDLLPGDILEEVEAGVGEPERVAGTQAPLGRAIDPGPGDHPLGRAIRALKPEILDEARVRRWFRFRLAEGARAVLRLTGGGDVLLAERTVGRGKVLVFATSVDASWNDLPANPVYPILIQEALTHLGRRASERPCTVGDPVVLALPSEAEVDESVFRDPAGASYPVRIEAVDGLRLARLPSASLPGFYTIDAGGNPPLASANRPVSGRESGAAADREDPAVVAPLLAAVNVDPRESDVKALDLPGMARAVEGPGVRVIGESEDVAAVVREARTGRELWRELMLAALGILALESILARRFSRRMAEGGSR